MPQKVREKHFQPQASRGVMSVFHLLWGLLQYVTAVVTEFGHLQPTEFRAIHTSSEKASDNVGGFLPHFILNFSN